MVPSSVSKMWKEKGERGRREGKERREEGGGREVGKRGKGEEEGRERGRRGEGRKGEEGREGREKREWKGGERGKGGEGEEGMGRRRGEGRRGVGKVPNACSCVPLSIIHNFLSCRHAHGSWRKSIWSSWNG